MQKFSMKWVPKCLNVDQKRQQCQLSEQLLEFFQRDPNDFLSRLVTMDETWLYHYDSETKQQSIEWWHSGSPHPKIFQVQKSAEKVLASIFLGSRQHLPNWLSFKGPNYQHGVLLISASGIQGRFEGKTLREVYQRGLVLARQCPSSPGTCNPEETGLSGLASIVLTTHLILRIWPRRTTTCSLDWKHNWKVAIFRLTQRSSLPRRPGWTNNLPNFFWVTCKSYSNRLRSVLSFMESMLNKSQVWSL